MRVVAAPDKFRGTATAVEVAAAIGRAATAAGWECDEIPVADGGEGTLAAFGGPNRTTTVTGPLGDPVDAQWRLDRRTAVIEMAEASGLVLVGGPDGNDPIAADTHGTGELIQLAVESGARKVIVGLGGSATVDGGLGALRAMYPLQRYREVDLRVACDVRTTFLDAAEVFGPQKGASAAQLRLLSRRLARLAEVYEQDHGIDVRDLPGSGAAGGLAGGLAAAGAELADGFALIADEVRLDEAIEGADLVITGEGFVDDESFAGKVVGGVAELAASLDVPVVAVAGRVLDGAGDRIDAISLVDRDGEEVAMTDTVACVESAVAEVLAARA
ncbi:MAG: glycerate kinase [Acidimicrobiales bacterium]|nr:glycerate kinase [Acidimicrobiales bacterium]